MSSRPWWTWPASTRTATTPTCRPANRRRSRRPPRRSGPATWSASAWSGRATASCSTRADWPISWPIFLPHGRRGLRPLKTRSAAPRAAADCRFVCRLLSWTREGHHVAVRRPDHFLGHPHRVEPEICDRHGHALPLQLGDDRLSHLHQPGQLRSRIAHHRALGKASLWVASASRYGLFTAIARSISSG
ncbi:hypothetical protein CWO91_26675 [Bradyrhizobium genosp. SA-3]|nr:hypothetical protein CWO91_26675 [Bradyrhizobium genosp. SA-3]